MEGSNALDPHWSGWPDPVPGLVVQEKLTALYEKILAGNRQFNLTRITEPGDFIEKHLWDSLAGIQGEAWPAGKLSVMDIGTGGGFPGLPIALMQDQWQVTLLDSTRKKITFLEQLGQELGLTNVRYQVGRAETLGQNSRHREQYDLATLRAVADAVVCAEYGLPFLKLGGCLILYRGQWTSEEGDRLALACKALGGQIQAIKPLLTPWTQAQRHFIYLTKTHPTPPEFPRAIGLPQHHPLA